MNGGLPHCAVCNKPVDKMEWFDNFDSHHRTFRAFCHGQVEVVDLPNILLIDNLSIEYATAFNQKRLEEK